MALNSVEQLFLPEVDAARGGDQAAFRRLIDYCRNSVSSIALAIVKDLDASEEVTQQVFISIWQQLPELKNAASFLPWVRQITRYRAYNYLRDNKVKQRLTLDEAEELLMLEASESEPGAELARQQQNEVMRSFISDLPADSREIVLLYYREEQNSQQVAELLGLSESNVRKKLQRVREQLKTKLMKRYGRLILTTAPGAGLTTAICSALVVSSPPLSAATASVVTGHSTGLAKIGWLFSGAMLGAIGGVLAVLLGMHYPLKNARSVEERQQLLRLRNRVILWVFMAGVMLALAYELTTGAVAPIVAYSLFLAGVGYLQLGVWRITSPALKAAAAYDQKAAARYKQDLFWSWFGLVGGYGSGFVALMVGLNASGRLFG